MKIGLAVCKCEINFNNYTTTFMFAEMFDTGLLFPDSTCFMGQLICLQIFDGYALKLEFRMNGRLEDFAWTVLLEQRFSQFEN